MKSNKKQNTCKFLYERMGNRKIYFVLSVLFAILSVVCEMIPFYFVAAMIDQLIKGNADLWYYGQNTLIILGFFVLKIIFHGVSTSLSHFSTFKILGNMRKDCTEKLSRMPLGEVTSRQVGSLKSTIIERIDSIETTLAHVIPEMTSNLFPPLIIIITIFIIDWRMGFVSIITLPIGFICMSLMMIGADKFFKRVLKATKNLNDCSVEYINGIEVIKVFGKSKSSYEKFVSAANENASSYYDWMKKSNITMTLALVVMPATMITILPIGAIFTANGSITISAMIVIILLSVGMVDPLIRVGAYQDDVRQIPVIVSQVLDILNAPELERPETLDPKNEIKNNELVLKDVHFAYQKDEVLHGINLDIKDGEYIALVGPSGSGKSTIAKLIASMWDVNDGSISIGGVNIKDIPFDIYADKIAYVSQDNYLFNVSIMENLKYGCTTKDISDEEVIEICKKSGVHDFIMSLEHGYDTIVGSYGSHLSGGEKQRICIARAMIKDAPIVILDEATSYSDPENESIIQESVSKLVQGKTLIVIAHRLSTISDADKIVLVNNGNIEAQGTHEELLENNINYKHMWEAHISVKDTKEVQHD